jgi:hypothetical protein
MAKEKTNQEGGAILAKDPKAAAMELKKNQKGAAKGMDHKKGGAKYVKGAAKPKPDANGDGIPDYAQDGIGASRMGYNQSFGAARVSGYSKGAAKVADIMSFGASKYMNHGAADAGHGGVAGHNHPSMTTKKRSTSGGGSSSSSSSTSGTSNYDAVVKSEGTKIVDPSKITPAMTAAANAKRASAKKLDASSSSTSSGGGSSTTSSNTITSKNSMAESQLQGKIKAENRQSLNAFKRAETNIKASNDSITVSNAFLNKLPTKTSMNPKAKLIAAKKGGRAAMTTRARSGNFSSQEALGIYKAGQR